MKSKISSRSRAEGAVGSRKGLALKGATQAAEAVVVKPRETVPQASGYHKRVIPRGEFGKISKIREELEELEDSYDQGVRIMVLCELADLYGALEGFALTQGVTMNDLRSMNDRTKKAFSDGTRVPRTSEA